MGLFDFGVGGSAGGGSTTQDNFNVSSNTLFAPQAEAFSQLFPAATQLAQQQSQQIGGIAQPLAADLTGQGFGFLGQLGGGQNSAINPLSQFQGGGGQNQGLSALQNFAAGGGNNNFFPQQQQAFNPNQNVPQMFQGQPRQFQPGFGGQEQQQFFGRPGQAGLGQRPNIFGQGGQNRAPEFESDRNIGQRDSFASSPILDSFAGSSNGLLAGGFQQLQQLAQGGSALQQQLASSSPNEFLEGSIDALGGDISRQLERQNVGIGQDAALAGQRGGSRQGVAEGIASEAALRDFSQQAGQIRAQDAAQQRELQQQGQQSALQAQLQASQGQVQGGLAGRGQTLADAQEQGRQGLTGQGQFNQNQQAQQQAALQNQGQQFQNQQAQQQFGLQGQGLGLEAELGRGQLGLGNQAQQFQNQQSIRNSQLGARGQDIQSQLGQGQIGLGQNAQQLQAAQSLGQLGLGQQQLDQGAQQQQLQALIASGQLQNQQQQNQNQGAQAGLGSLGNLFNLGLGGFGAEFSPLQSLAGLANPINQQFSFGSGQSNSVQQSGNGGFNIGF